MANLMGIGKGIITQSGKNTSSQEQNGFFALLSQKMDAIPDIALLVPGQTGDASSDVLAATGEDDTAAECKNTALDQVQMSALASSIVSILKQQETTGSFSEKELSNITDFLNSVLDVLSAGDEIELSGGKADDGLACDDTGNKSTDNTSAASLTGSLAAFAAALDKMARQDNTTEASSDAGASPGTDLAGAASLPGVDDVKPRSKAPDVPSAAKADISGMALGPETGTEKSDVQNQAFMVEVAKSSKENKVVDISVNRPAEAAAISKPVELTDNKTEKVSDLSDAKARKQVDFDKIIVRVVEKEETDLKDDTGDGSGNDNQMNLHGSSQHHNEQNVAEAKNVAKHDFGSVMIDKIEKLTEQYTGKNVGMDMTVKLKIDDHETLLIGLKNEGESVTVEVKAANENTMNFIDSQKNDITKNLEEKNIMTSIHVNIDQDSQGRRQDRNHQEKNEDVTEENQNFGDFFEAIA